MRGAKEAIGYDCEGLQSGEYGCAVHTCGACAMSVMSEEEVSRRLSCEGLFDHPSCPILYKILVSVLNRPFLHKQNSKSCHYFLLVCDSKSENLSGHFFVSS